MQTEKNADFPTAVAIMNGKALLHDYILMELVLAGAAASDEPGKYLSGMFERISARADQMSLEDQARPAVAQFRRLLEEFFVLAGSTVSRNHLDS